MNFQKNSDEVLQFALAIAGVFGLVALFKSRKSEILGSNTNKNQELI
jgi:hypothetical protein